MARLSTTVLFLSMFSSLGMGAQNGLDDHLDLPGLLANFRAAAVTLKGFKDKPEERAPTEEESYQKALHRLYTRKSAVLYHGVDLGKDPSSGPIITPEERTLMRQNMELLNAIWAEEP